VPGAAPKPTHDSMSEIARMQSAELPRYLEPIREALNVLAQALADDVVKEWRAAPSQPVRITLRRMPHRGVAANETRNAY